MNMCCRILESVNLAINTTYSKQTYQHLFNKQLSPLMTIYKKSGSSGPLFLYEYSSSNTS